MTDHTHSHTHSHSHTHTDGIERFTDVAVVGGSAAGLAAALQLGRQRRSVVVVDAGEPRNAPAAHMHGYLGREGLPPSELIDIGRKEVRMYGGEVIDGRVVDVTRHESGRFRVGLVGGHALIARRVLIATGLVDELPDIAGLQDHWGGDVFHCPFCHGYEVRDRRIVQIVSEPMHLHPSGLLRNLSQDLTIVLHSGVDPDHDDVERLLASGVNVVADRARRIVEGDDGRIIGVELEGGRVIDADVVMVGPRFRVRAEPFASVGVVPIDHASGLGAVVETDAMGATDVAGVFAAGNVTDPSQQVLQAAANGSFVGAAISASLAGEDLAQAARPSGNEVDWDLRYESDVMWSGRPNPTLVAEIGEMDPGSAFDVGAGEGGDAVWLAEQGWVVTASDISQVALGKASTEAQRRGLEIETIRADANALDPFGGRTFDLVTAHYASIPRTADGRAQRNLLDAVGPGGTLLIVGHDPEAMNTPVDTNVESRLYDPDAYVQAPDVLAAIEDSDDWRVEVHERRERPTNPDGPTHHIADIVLRASRT